MNPFCRQFSPFSAQALVIFTCLKHRLEMYPPNPRTVKGTLRKIKEDQRLIVYDLKNPLPGLTGSIYVYCEWSYNHLWDKLVLEYDATEC